MKKYIIWGGAGHARVIFELLNAQNHSIAAVVDNCIVPAPLQSVPLLHGEAGLKTWLQKNPDKYYGVVAIGTAGKNRLELLDLLNQLNITTSYVEHHTAFVASTAKIEDGAQILAKSCICASAHIGKGVIVNTASIVEHDVCVGAGAHIAPGVSIAGECNIGSCCFIGAGTTILPRITIGDNTIIGAGSVVTRDMAANVVAVGSPARVTRKL